MEAEVVPYEDYAAVVQLLSKYTYVFDGRQWDELDALFAEEGVFDLSAFGIEPAVGLGSIRRLVDRMPGGIFHQASIPLIVNADDSGIELLSKYCNISS